MQAQLPYCNCNWRSRHRSCPCRWRRNWKRTCNRHRSSRHIHPRTCRTRPWPCRSNSRGSCLRSSRRSRLRRRRRSCRSNCNRHRKARCSRRRNSRSRRKPCCRSGQAPRQRPLPRDHREPGREPVNDSYHVLLFRVRCYFFRSRRTSRSYMRTYPRNETFAPLRSSSKSERWLMVIARGESGANQFSQTPKSVWQD